MLNVKKMTHACLMLAILLGVASISTAHPVTNSDDPVSLVDALKQGELTMTYIELAMKSSMASYEAILPLIGDEQSEQRQQIAAKLAEVNKKHKSGNLDTDYIEGVNQVGEEISKVKLEAATDKKVAEKAVRKAYFLSGLALAMDLTAAVNAKRDAEQIQDGMKNAKKDFKNPLAAAKQVKQGKKFVEALSAFTKGLPAQKSNLDFVRTNCKQVSKDLKFSLPSEIDPEKVRDLPSAVEVSETNLD